MRPLFWVEMVGTMSPLLAFSLDKSALIFPDRSLTVLDYARLRNVHTLILIWVKCSADLVNGIVLINIIWNKKIKTRFTVFYGFNCTAATLDSVWLKWVLATLHKASFSLFKATLHLHSYCPSMLNIFRNPLNHGNNSMFNRPFTKYLGDFFRVSLRWNIRKLNFFSIVIIKYLRLQSHQSEGKLEFRRTAVLINLVFNYLCLQVTKKLFAKNTQFYWHIEWVLNNFSITCAK
jgi:hypothetical protein